MRNRVRVFFLFFITLSSLTFAQTTLSKYKTSLSPIPQNISVQNKPGHLIQAFSLKDSVYVVDVDLTEKIDIIIQFKDEAMFMKMKRGIRNKADVQSYNALQTQLDNDLNRFYASAHKALNTDLPSISKKCAYFKVFNGAAYSVPRAILSDIASLGYVQKIYMDKTVKASVDDNIHLIGADSVWEKYSDQGDSVVVGVIDTGIDYTHPALGGGFGKGFKVIGGYDFFNNDSDPMDDNNHGTHVAGIIAGNSETFKGVAPHALLLGYKVLDGAGNGLFSTILQGIEAVADPNNDNNYDDKADVVNMSLGGTGDSNDALSTAVNNCVELGITFCIAAGNEGNPYSIGSPGAAESAITVGASDNNDKLAEFSSLGPNAGNFSIKPEILAPGVNINSSIPGNQFAVYSGTSMASPHVAGVCALLKHLHKDWTPEMIKSAIMTSAKDLALNPMQQGAGRIDAVKAISENTFVLPSKINFGIDYDSATIFAATDSVVVMNKSLAVKNYAIRIDGSVNGLTVSPAVNSISVNPNETVKIIFNLNVNNSILQKPDINLKSYSGKVYLTCQDDTLIFPWSLARSSYIIINYDKPIYFSYLFDSSNVYVHIPLVSFAPYTYKTLLPKGQYNCFTAFAANDTIHGGNERISCVMHSNININGYANLNISSNEAINKITFNGTDENGRLLRELDNSYYFFALGNDDPQSTIPLYYTVYMLPSSYTIKTSNIDKSIGIKTCQFQMSLNAEHKIRTLQFPILNGISSDINLVNTPDKYITQNINLDLPNSAYYNRTYFNPVCCFNSDLYLTFRIANEYVSTKKWSGILYTTKDQNSSNCFDASITAINYFDLSIYNLSTKLLVGINDSVAIIPITDDSTYSLWASPNHASLSFGNGAIAPHMLFSHSTYNKFLLRPSLFGQLSEDISSLLYESTAQLSGLRNGFSFNGLLSELCNTNIPFNDNYSLSAHVNGYNVDNISGKAELKYNFVVGQFPSGPYCPPSINAIRLLDKDNTVRSRYDINEQGKLQISMEKPANLNVFIKKSTSKTWDTLKLSAPHNYYKTVLYDADISPYLLKDSAAYDLKIRVNAADTAHCTEWTLYPAFIVGNYVTGVEADSIKTAAAPKQFCLYSNYPNPFNPSTTIKYDIPRQALVQLKVYNVLGKEIATLVNKEQLAGTYSVKFDALNLASGIYFYTIKAGNYTTSKKMLLLK